MQKFTVAPLTSEKVFGPVCNWQKIIHGPINLQLKKTSGPVFYLCHRPVFPLWEWPWKPKYIPWPRNGVQLRDKNNQWSRNKFSDLVFPLILTDPLRRVNFGACFTTAAWPNGPRSHLYELSKLSNVFHVKYLSKYMALIARSVIVFPVEEYLLFSFLETHSPLGNLISSNEMIEKLIFLWKKWRWKSKELLKNTSSGIKRGFDKGSSFAKLKYVNHLYVMVSSALPEWRHSSGWPIFLERFSSRNYVTFWWLKYFSYFASQR